MAKDFWFVKCLTKQNHVFLGIIYLLTKGIITIGKFDGFLLNKCNVYPLKGEKELNLNIRGTLHLYVYDIKNAKYIPTV